MAGGRIGTIFVELDLDPTRYLKGQKALLREAKGASNNLERNFQNLGIKSDATFDLMRSRASLAYNAIKNDARSTFSDMTRAHQAYGVEMQRITLEQFQQEKNLNEQRKQMSRDSQSGWLSMMKGMLAYRIILSGIMAVQEAFAGTFRYLATIETATLGIGAAFMTSGKYIDETTGKALEGSAALKAAQIDSKKIIEELKIANLSTIATLDQLIIAYQQTLPVAMAKGFNRQQVKDFTLAMVQAAGAIGLPFEQMGEETRSLLTGAINPRTSRIATVLGLRNEDIAEFKNNAQGLFDFLMAKLQAYKVAGIESQTTWAGLMSNMKDMAFQYLGEAMTPLFEGIKASLVDITKSMVYIDDKTGKVGWNPEFLEDMKAIRSAFTTFVADLRRIAMLIDLVGIGLALLGQLSPFAGWRKYFAEMEVTFTKRLKENERALMDSAMKAEGWTQAKLGVFYSGKETKGGPDDFRFYDKTITYIQEIEEKTTYQANATEKLTEEMKTLLERWTDTKTSLQADINSEGLESLGRKFEEISAKAEKLTKDFKDVKGAAEFIAKWKESRESKAIIDEEKKIYDAVEKIRTDAMKNNMDEVKIKIAWDAKYYDEREKALEKYQNIVDKANEWNLDKHQKAINERLNLEKKNVADINEAYELGAIDLAQRDAGIAAVRAATASATYEQLIKDLKDKFGGMWDYANQTAEDSFRSMMDVGLRAFQGLEDALVSFAMTGKKSFTDWANSVIADIMRIMIRASVLQPLAGGLVGFFSPGTTGTTSIAGSGFAGTIPGSTTFPAMASGGPVSGGSAYLVGERGPELFVPSSSGSIVPGGKGGNVTVNISNQSGTPVTAKASSSFDMSGAVIDIVLDGLNRNVHGLRTALGGA